MTTTPSPAVRHPGQHLAALAARDAGAGTFHDLPEDPDVGETLGLLPHQRLQALWHLRQGDLIGDETLIAVRGRLGPVPARTGRRWHLDPRCQAPRGDRRRHQLTYIELAATLRRPTDGGGSFTLCECFVTYPFSEAVLDHTGYTLTRADHAVLHWLCATDNRGVTSDARGSLWGHLLTGPTPMWPGAPTPLDLTTTHPDLLDRATHRWRTRRRQLLTHPHHLLDDLHPATRPDPGPLTGHDDEATVAHAWRRRAMVTLTSELCSADHRSGDPTDLLPALAGHTARVRAAAHTWQSAWKGAIAAPTGTDEAERAPMRPNGHARSSRRWTRRPGRR